MLELTESEFVNLKNEQSLLVEFSAFPAKLTELLELCIESQDRDDKVKFVCVLDTTTKKGGEANFNIVETNQFKALVHLTLKMRQASDEMLKKYLSYNLLKEEAENENLRQRNIQLEEAVRIKESDIKMMKLELQRFNEEKEKQIEKLIFEENKKLTILKEEYLLREEKSLTQNDQDKRLMIDRYEKIINDLNNKLEKAQTLSSQNAGAKNDLETREREMKNKIKALEAELSLAIKENDNFRIQNKELDQTRFQQEKLLTELKVKNESQEKQIADKETILAQNREMTDNATQQLKMQENEVSNCKKTIEKLERKLNESMEQINKGNDVIERLQHEIKSQKQKIKFKNNIMKQQEQNITQQQQSLEKLTMQLLESKRESDMKEVKIKDFENQVSDYKSKIDESQKIIESNNSMITYLNKTLNELQKPSMRYTNFQNQSQIQPIPSTKSSAVIGNSYTSSGQPHSSYLANTTSVPTTYSQTLYDNVKFIYNQLFAVEISTSKFCYNHRETRLELFEQCEKNGRRVQGES